MKAISFLLAMCACTFVPACNKSNEVDTDPAQPTIVLVEAADHGNHTVNKRVAIHIHP